MSDTAGQSAAQGQMTSDKGTSTQSVSSTDVYCTNLTAYHNATIYNDIDCRGNIHCTLPGGTVFAETTDTHNVIASSYITAPKTTTNYAIVNTSLSAPHIDCTNDITTSYAKVNMSLSTPHIDCTGDISSAHITCNSSMQCDSIKIGNTSMQPIGGQFIIDVQNHNAHVFLRLMEKQLLL